MRIKPLIILMRPHQYVKNSFVMIGPIFGHYWTAPAILDAALIFVSFCFVASSVYIFNDLIDIDSDASHPIKKKRPLPSGEVSTGLAKLVMILLLASSLSLTSIVSYYVLFFVALYVFINVLYSLCLKNIVILDVFIISIGFMLRILSGTVGLNIPPSAWLLLCGFMVTLFLGFAKRKAELQMTVATKKSKENHFRKVLNDYNGKMVDQFLAITAACTIICYGLYTVSDQTIQIHGTSNLIYSLPFVVYGVFRYFFLLENREKGDDAAKDLIADPHLVITILIWLFIVIWMIR